MKRIGILGIVGLLTFWDAIVLVGANFINLPARVNLSENTDPPAQLINVNATCYGSSNNTVRCDNCLIAAVSGSSATDLFDISGTTVYKKNCSKPGCGNYPSGSTCSNFYGCTNAGESFSITIRCSTSAQQIQSTLDVVITAETPTLTINLPATVNVSRSMSRNSVFFMVDKISGPDIVEWTKTTSISSFLLKTKDLFDVDPKTGSVYIKEDPSQEYTYWYSMELCIFSRRQQSCGNLTINFDGGFEQPTCTDLDAYVDDQHEIGETLFVMKYPPPSGQFASISSTWQNLTFEIASTTLDVATINATTGDITTTGNITVWPSYPTRQFNITVRVSNPGYSFGYRTCTMSLFVSFTNWPITILSLPASYTTHEDMDAEIIVHNLTTFDYNNPTQDNVTCKITGEENLFELRHNGAYTQTAFSIAKNACQDPGCGFLCPLNRSCLNYNLKSSYDVTVTCRDAYGSEDTGVFTLIISKNGIPSWNNNASVTVDTTKVSVGDVLFPISYNDAEGEDLTFIFSVTPEPSQQLFEFGSNHGNPLNITAAGCLRLVNDTIYNVSWSAYDRRNLVHSSLIISLTNTCNSLVSPSGGYYNFTSTCDVIMATFSCRPGFVMSGNETRYCQNDGSWNGTNPTCEPTGIKNLPATVSISENFDNTGMLFEIEALCYPSGKESCDYCDITSNPSPTLFFVTGNKTGYSVWKNECNDSTCGNYPSASPCSELGGCFDSNVRNAFDLEITCSDSFSEMTSILTVNITAEEPTLVIHLPASANASSKMSPITTFFTVDKLSGPDIMEWSRISSISSYLLNTQDLFDINPHNGSVYIKKDPSQEYTYWYTMEVCIYSRRQESCGALTINFDGCFQTPTCTNQLEIFTDLHGIGETLFRMAYPEPSEHFPLISSSWQNLTFAITSTTLDVATINATTGDITTTGNITVWPSYPSKQFNITVEVSNPGYSCGYGTCTMLPLVYFTDWPISILSLPASYTIHEDMDAEIIVHNITTFDNNDPTQDNVTCEMNATGGSDLFTLIHNGAYNQTAFSIQKNACQHPRCGYINDNFLCPLNTGCLNHNLTSAYDVTLTCYDAYGAVDTRMFSLIISKNGIPTWNNNASVTVDTTKISVGDVLFPISYIDAEGENLTYNFTVTPEQFQPLFDFGNNHGNPLNITAAGCLRLVNNTIYNVSWSAYDRRNLVQSSLIIKLISMSSHKRRIRLNCKSREIRLNISKLEKKRINLQCIV